MVTDPRNRPINGAICSYTAPNTVYLATLLHPQAFPMTCEVLWSSDMSKSESWGKTTEGQKGSKIKKALFSKKGCKPSALWLHKRQHRKKGGWMEEHRTEEDSRKQQLFPSSPASPVGTANSPTWITGCTPLAVHGEKQEHHQSNLFQMSAYKWLPFCSDRVWLAYSDIKNSVQMSELN